LIFETSSCFKIKLSNSIFSRFSERFFRLTDLPSCVAASHNDDPRVSDIQVISSGNNRDTSYDFSSKSHFDHRNHYSIEQFSIGVAVTDLNDIFIPMGPGGHLRSARYYQILLTISSFKL
jgi:hypothetical protein